MHAPLGVASVGAALMQGQPSAYSVPADLLFLTFQGGWAGLCQPCTRVPTTTKCVFALRVRGYDNPQVGYLFAVFTGPESAK
jgi:hypothetical protein